MGDEDNLIYGDYNFIETEESKIIGDTIEKELQAHNLIQYYIENVPVKNYKEGVPAKKATENDKKEIINNIFTTMETIIKDHIIKSISQKEEKKKKKEVIEEVFKGLKIF